MDGMFIFGEQPEKVGFKVRSSNWFTFCYFVFVCYLFVIYLASDVYKK